MLSRLIEQKPAPPPDADLQSKEPPVVTKHVIILDDSASMADGSKQEEGAERGQIIYAYARARKAINDYIVGIVAADNKPHEFVIIKMSNPDKFRDFELLTSSSRLEIEKYLKEEYTAQPFHYDMLPSLKKSKDLFDELSKDNLILHIVSDFRASDWNNATRNALGKFFEHFEKAKVQVKLHDVAAPKREGDKVVSNENLAIVDFRAESSVVVKDNPIEFTVTVANHGNSDRQNVAVKLKVNNKEELRGTVNFLLIPANDTATGRVTFSLNRTAPKDNNSTRGENARFDGFNLVSAQFDENHRDGLAGDDLRYTVVEVRDSISMLIVDNKIQDRGTKNAESFYLWKLFTETLKGFDIEVKTAAEMEKLNLSRYSAVVLCDIPTLSPVGVQKLESFLNAGGGVGFFMGSSIRDPKFYNEQLWKEGKGMFPAPLKEIANKNATNEQLNQIMQEQENSFYAKLLVRKEMRRHPALEKLYADSRNQSFNDLQYERTFNIVAFARYYLVDRPKWKPGDDVQTLLYLPSNRSVADFERRTKDLLRRLREAIDADLQLSLLQQQLGQAKDDAQKRVLQQKIEKLPTEMEKFNKFKKSVKEYSDAISNVVGKYDNPLHKLVFEVAGLIPDPADTKNSDPLMLEFWQAPSCRI